MPTKVFLPFRVQEEEEGEEEEKGDCCSQPLKVPPPSGSVG